MIKHTIFTGCARPALFLGVPLLVLVLSGLATMLIAGTLARFISVWAALPVILAFAIFFFWAKAITKLDEWRLAQVMQKLRLRKGNKAVKSVGGLIYSPYQLLKRKT
jgi:type IV secretory pathway VirB3-like protein